MDRMENPFSPGAGTRPPALIGRDEVMENARILLGRALLGRPERQIALVGLRGVGKTVLLRKISELSVKSKYHSVYFEIDDGFDFLQNLVIQLRSILIKMSRTGFLSNGVRYAWSALKAFARSFNIKYQDFEFGMEIPESDGTTDSGIMDSDLSNLFLCVGNAAKENKTGIAILVDEMQFIKKDICSALLMAIHRVQQEEMPIILICAGLPDLYRVIGESKSYAERLINFYFIGPLKKDEVSNAIRIPLREKNIEIEDDALEEIYNKTQGYPYFLQEWGYNVWNCAKNNTILKSDVLCANEISIENLDRGFFKMRFERLSNGEREFIYAMASLGKGPYKIKDVALLLKKNVNSVSPIRSKKSLKSGTVNSIIA